MKNKVKKIVNLLLIFVICFVSSSLFTACSNDKGTKLTVDNYKTYLSVSAELDGDYDYLSSDGEYWHKNIIGSVLIKSMSDNIIFSNVVVEVKIVGEFGMKKSSGSGYHYLNEYNETIKITLDINGKGSGTKIVNVYSSHASPDSIPSYSRTDADYIKGSHFEVVKISGTVEVV